MVVETVDVHTACDVVKLQAVARSKGYPEDGTDEGNSYALFTPSAVLQLTVTNPDLLGKFRPGQKYYLDFTQAEK